MQSNKAPGITNSQSNLKTTTKKKEVISVACQTDLDLFETESSGEAGPSTCPDLKEVNEMMGELVATTSSKTPEKKPVRTKVKKSASIDFKVETVCSAPRRVQGIPWRIMVMPKQHIVQKKQQKCMGFFLQCCPEKPYSDSWTCKAEAEMRLMSKKLGTGNFVRKTSHIYTAKENDWGYSCFMTWADVLDEHQGYIRDDKISLEITVKAESPKNLIGRSEFVKAIDQWYNLAEMQIKRGFIDLSLEANSQALRYCKDRDTGIKAKLEEQKQRLVNKKVLDSINRIENPDVQAKPPEPLKTTSLRQALNGAQKTIVSKNSKGPIKQRDRKPLHQQIKKKKQEGAAVKQELNNHVKGAGPCNAVCPPCWPGPDRNTDGYDYDSSEEELSEEEEELDLSTSEIQEVQNEIQARDGDKRLQESDSLVKRLGNSLQEEIEKNDKLKAEVLEHQVKLKDFSQQIHNLSAQLKEHKMNAKKMEKKAKQDDIKIATLFADKMELDEKLKASRRDCDQIKKKNDTDRANAKKQKERDAEIIHRLEQQVAENQTEIDREKSLFEEKLRDARTKENKAERERKQAIFSLNAAVERSKVSESAQILLLLSIQNQRIDKAKEEIKISFAEIEANISSSFHDHSSYKKNTRNEWKAALNELERIRKALEREYKHAADTIIKGHAIFSQLELSVPILPTLPKSLSVLRSSNSSENVLPAPEIALPRAGVIGDRRVRDVVRKSHFTSHKVDSPFSGNETMSSLSSYKPIDKEQYLSEKSHFELGQNPLRTKESSLWSWSEKMEKMTRSIIENNNYMIEPWQEQIIKPLEVKCHVESDELNLVHQVKNNEKLNVSSSSHDWQDNASMEEEEQQFDQTLQVSQRFKEL